jgi:hypothetical protein
LQFKGYITKRNEKLFEEVKRTFSINFEFSAENNARISYKKNIATIFLPLGKTSEEDVTHELLHLYLETKENLVYCIIQGQINENQTLKKIFHDDLTIHVLNCLQHIKMLPIFCNMGYNKMDFLVDSETMKCNIEFAKEIKRKFKFLFFYNKSVIDNYIGKYFSMKADVNEYKYKEEISILAKTDAKLFQILETFWNKWIAYDIYNESVNYWLDDFAGEFMESLATWIQKRTIL